MAQPIKKGQTIKKNSLSDWKQKRGLDAKDGEMVRNSNANKPQEWILMPKAFQEATKLPGIPQSTVVSVIGHSNVGKSTLINHAITSAQKQGLIPVIIDTENSFSFQYAKQMGFEAEPVYGDVDVEEVNTETGEVTMRKENRIVQWEGNFVYYNNAILCEQYGNIDYATDTVTKSKRKIAVIEDVARCINDLLDAQDNGEIDRGFLFVWDSVGSIGSFRGFKSGKTANPMWDAAANSQAFNVIMNDRIPSSKKITSQYSNTLLYINKVWLNAMLNPVGPPVLEKKGGKSFGYAARLEILLGGQLSSGIKRLKAKSKGLDYTFGIETKIKVLKNHLDAPYNVVYEGSLIACDIGFIGVDDLEDYKKTHISSILKELNNLGKSKSIEVTASDIEYAESDEDE